MHQSYFMRQQKRRVLRWTLTALFFSPISIGMALNWLDHTDESAHGDLIFIGLFTLFSFIALIGIAEMVNAVIWKCTIQGEHIRYCSLYHRKDFTFHDIERVAYHHSPGSLYTLDTSAWHIFLFGEKRPFTVPAKASGVHIFLECLRNRNIPGSFQSERTK